MRKDYGGIYIIRGVACYVHLEACEVDYSPCADAMKLSAGDSTMKIKQNYIKKT